MGAPVNTFKLMEGGGGECHYFYPYLFEPTCRTELDFVDFSLRKSLFY